MTKVPEKVIFDEPEVKTSFFGRKYFVPPKKVPHFSNLQFKEEYKAVRAHVIVNPYSGKKKGSKIATLVKDELRNSKINVEIYETEKPEHAIDIVKTLILDEGDTILTIGGDGTFCEVISGFMDRSDDSVSNIPLGLIPAGTGNSQANDMEIIDYRDAVERIISGRVRLIDIAETKFMDGNNEVVRHSHNLVGWGLGVDSNILAEKMRFLGPLRYDIGVLLSILRGKVRKAKCFIDGHLIESDFVLLLIQNTCTGGDRLRLAPKAQIDDGKMDLGIIYHIGRFKILKLFNQLKAQGSHVWNPNVEFYRFKTLRIETETPTSINIDGENLGTTPLEIKVLPSSIKVFN
jgi:YegS/Rv2252/BmrU family lipid kinase|tara:strand:+ start:99 stop:1139 length:1041 start_codon:yes stop_codon:yes gene_type:complete